MLTARDSEADVVAGLEKGADDYVSKPCRPRELLARVRTRLRERTRRSIAAAQPEHSAAEQAVVIGSLVIDPERMRVTKKNETLDISAREFDFLYLLASHPGKPFSRDVLLREIWEAGVEDYKQNISVFVSRLRRKLEDDPDNPRYLLTVHGVGYRFAEPSEFKG
jgi:two-component system alkaline phosphatase synthesis response regulator PhoP